ncbi:MAG: DsbA family protein [Myxococcota bacterium]
MRVALLLIAVMTLALVACSKKEEAPATEPAAGAAEEEPAAGDPAEEEPAEATEEGAAEEPAEEEAAAEEEAEPSEPAKPLSQKEMKDLEGQPGATDALSGHTVEPGPAHESLEGKPGPSPALGPDDAPVKVFVFSDFQCPVCSRVVEPVKALHRELGDDVQVVFKHNALEMHPNASAAAAAAIAAQKQGKFWAYHDKLFQNQRNLHEQDLILYAEELGLDSEKFQEDMEAEATREQVAYERSLAAALELRGTPGFLINGRKMVGWGSYGGFKGMVEAALRKAKEVGDDVPAEDVAVEATKAQGEDGRKFAELYWGVEAGE